MTLFMRLAAREPGQRYDARLRRWFAGMFAGGDFIAYSVGCTHRIRHYTGFEGALTLPLATIIALGLPKQQEISAKLADGSLTKVGVYRGSIFWHGVTVNLAVLAMDSDPLLGTSLLDGNLLFIDWADQGEVRIEQRP